MKKTIIVLAVLALCFSMLIGCSHNDSNNAGSNNSDAENAGQLSEPGEKTTYTFSEYLRKSNESPLLFFSLSNVSKNEEVYHVYVVQNEKVKMYENYGEKTIGDYAKMSDSEIIAYLEEEWEKELVALVQSFINDPAWITRFRSGEASVYVKNYLTPEVALITDDTGNNVARQMVYFPKENSLSFGSTVRYDGLFWDEPTNKDYIASSRISCMTDEYCFERPSQMYDIYSSRYIGLAPAAGGYGLSRYLLTRSSTDVTITFDKMDGSVVVDPDYKAEENIAYAFFQQYCKNFETFDELSKHIPSLNLPTVPDTLKIGYTEWMDFAYVDQGGKLTGYDIELMQKICDELGITADFISVENLEGYEVLRNGDIDCLIGGLNYRYDDDFYWIASLRSYSDGFSYDSCGLAFRKNVEGLDLIEQVCRKFAQDGTIGALLNQYRHAYIGQ